MEPKFGGGGERLGFFIFHIFYNACCEIKKLKVFIVLKYV